MGISTRDLEEDEVKIDNLLNKILHSCKLIEELNYQVHTIRDFKLIDSDYVTERTKKIDILVKTVMNLAILADDIDVVDESVTEDLEEELRANINKAIGHIKRINNFLGKEASNNQKTDGE
jgi:hypothetical protein